MLNLTNNFVPKPPMPKQKFKPSPFQQAIFDFIEAVAITRAKSELYYVKTPEGDNVY